MNDSFRLYVLTRINIGFNGGCTVCGQKADHAEWLSTRLDIFERFTLPSMLAQTEQRFMWLLCFSPDTPGELLPRIMAYQSSRVRIVFSRMACEEGGAPLLRFRPTADDDPRADMEEISFKSHMPAQVIPVIEEDLRKSPVDWIVTTRIDSDDVVSDDFIEVIHRAEKGHQFISLPHGYVYDARTRQVWEKDSKYNAWISLVEPAVLGQIWTVWISSHTKPAVDYAKLARRTVPVIERGADRRRWIAIRHDSNSTPLERGQEVSLAQLSDNPHFAAVQW